MKADPVAVTINILDKEFRIACPEEERESLLRSAQFLNTRMREVRESGKVIGIDATSLTLQTEKSEVIIPLSKLASEKVEVFYPEGQEENLLEPGGPQG